MELNFDEAIKEINSINDLKTVVEYYGIKLSTKGSYIKAICPFHKEKTPSFSLNDEGSGAYYNCFGCGAGGNVINFIKDYKGLSTLEALKEAYKILGKKLDIKPSKIDRLINYIETNDFYKLEDYYIEDVYVYMVDTDVPSFLKIRYKLMPEKKDTGKKPKDMRTYKIVDAGEYYKTTTKASGGEYDPIIYNYPAVKKAIEKDNNIYFVEGEKDVKTLQRLGLTATTIYNTKKWLQTYTDQLDGAKVVFIGDTGKAGEEFKKTVYENLKDVVKTFKVVELPNIEALGDNADVTDWLNVEGNTKDVLIEAIKSAKLKPLKSWGKYHYNGVSTYLARTVNEEEQCMYIYDGMLNIESINIDIDNNKESLCISSKMYNKQVSTEITKGELFSKKSYAETLNNTRGFIIEPKHIGHVQEYLVEQYKIYDKANNLNEKMTTNRIGWIDNKHTNTFIYPRHDLSIDSKAFYKEDGRYNKIFKFKGDFNTYIEKVLTPLLSKDIGILTVSSLIGSLLLEVLDIHESFIVDIYGKNGKGKTILLFALASLFGKPRSYVLEWEATKNGIISNATDLNNFPLMLDDTKKCEDKDKIAEIVYSLSGGKEKARANQDGSAKEQKVFKNIAISTGETSLLNYIKGESSGAGVFGRVLSIDTDQYEIFNSKEEADLLENSYKNNYGLFGYEFCKWLYEQCKNENILEEWQDNYTKYKDDNYNKIEHHTSTRKANHIALLQMGYDILDKFLSSKGINIYLRPAVFDDYLLEADTMSMEQDIYTNAYNNIIEFIYSNPNRVYQADRDGDFPPNNMLGWVKNDIIYISDTETINSKLNLLGDYKDILKEWRERSYTINDVGRLQKNTRTPYKIDGKTKTIKTYAINTTIYQEQNKEEFEVIQGSF